MPLVLVMLLTTLVAMTLAGTGCSDSPPSFCETWATCEGLDDNELQQCEEQLDILREHADAAGCVDEWDAYLGCGAVAGDCTDGDWSFGEACGAQAIAHSVCMGWTSGDDDDTVWPGDDDDLG